jgi:hypothetical protein
MCHNARVHTTDPDRLEQLRAMAREARECEDADLDARLSAAESDVEADPIAWTGFLRCL